MACDRGRHDAARAVLRPCAASADASAPSGDEEAFGRWASGKWSWGRTRYASFGATLSGPRGRTSEEERALDDDDVLTIRDPTLLRAVSARRVLAGFGRVLKGSESTAETFELSEPVDGIDAFLSHAWSTPGWLKYLVLLYKTNGLRASLVAILVQVVVHGGELVGLWTIPHTYTMRAYLMDGRRPTECYIRLHFVFALAAFWVTLVCGHHLPFAGRRSWFLDKVCIHQTDMAKKQAGIQMLGAFLRRSKCMVVFWQPLYFERAWCVFELAAFLHMNRRGKTASTHVANIDFLPLKLPLFALGLHLFHSVATVGAACLLPLTILLKSNADWMAAMSEPVQLLYMLALATALLFALYTAPAVLLWSWVLQHLRDRHMLLEQLRTFSFAGTKCFSKEDHAFVRSKVEGWFGSTADFDAYVRELLMEKVSSLLVRGGPIPYRFVLFGCLPHLLVASSSVAEAFAHRDLRMGWQGVVMCINLYAVSDPLAVALVLRLGSRFLDSAPTATKAAWVRRFAPPLATAAICALPTGLALVTYMLTLPLWAAVLILALETAAVALLYCGGGVQARHGRLQEPPRVGLPPPAVSPATSLAPDSADPPAGVSSAGLTCHWRGVNATFSATSLALDSAEPSAGVHSAGLPCHEEGVDATFSI